MRKALVFGLVVILVCVFTFFYGQLKSSPEITQNLPAGDRDAASLEFKSRLQEKFPIGSESKHLVRFLIAEDFAMHYRFDHWKGSIYKSGFMCPNYWRVRWQADENGLITNIEGDWDNDCY